MAQLNLTIAVWGEAFTKIFLDFVLPCYLSPGNLPSLRSAFDKIEMHLYVGQSVEQQIRNHAAFQRLHQTVATRITSIDSLDPNYLQANVYETLNRCHLHFIDVSNNQKAAMVFLCPDSVWSDGTMQEIVRQSQLGKRAILVAGLRTVREDFVHEFGRIPFEKRFEGLPSRDLMKIAAQHPHRITKSLIWGSSSFDRGWPSHLLWPVNREGFLCRAFHLHTLFVHPRTSEKPSINHDFDWLSQLGFTENDFHVVQDSDQILAAEISPRDRPINAGPAGSSSILRTAVWVHRHTMSDHRQYFRKTILYHTGDTNTWAWRKARIHAWFIEKAIFACLPIAPVLIFLQRNLKAVRARVAATLKI